MTVPMLSDMVVICCNWKPLSALPVYHIRIVGWSCVIVPVCCQVERPQRPSDGSPKFRGRPWNWRHDFEILNMSEVQNELPDTVCVYIYILCNFNSEHVACTKQIQKTSKTEMPQNLWHQEVVFEPSDFSTMWFVNLSGKKSKFWRSWARWKPRPVHWQQYPRNPATNCCFVHLLLPTSTNLYTLYSSHETPINSLILFCICRVVLANSFEANRKLRTPLFVA